MFAVQCCAYSPTQYWALDFSVEFKLTGREPSKKIVNWNCHKAYPIFEHLCFTGIKQPLILFYSQLFWCRFLDFCRLHSKPKWRAAKITLYLIIQYCFCFAYVLVFVYASEEPFSRITLNLPVILKDLWRCNLFSLLFFLSYWIIT